MGNALLEKLDEDQMEHLIENQECDLKDYNPELKTHVAAALGAEKLGVNMGGVNATIRRAESLSKHCNSFQNNHGRDANVRVRKDLLFEVRDGEMPEREFGVLCAVYSCIGNKSKPVRITREQIQHRMLGYRSKAIVEAEELHRTTMIRDVRKSGPAHKIPTLTLRQINWTLDKLESRRFFVRSRANARQTYYSNRMSKEEMENHLFNSKTFFHEFQEDRKKRNAALMARIAAVNKPRPIGAIKVDSSIIVDTNTENRREPDDMSPIAARC